MSDDNFNDESDKRIVNTDVRRNYKPLTSDEKMTMVRLKDFGLKFLHEIEENVPRGREASIAKTKIEEAVMWAIKALTA